MKTKKRCKDCIHGCYNIGLWYFENNGWCSYWKNDIPHISKTDDKCEHYERKRWKIWRPK